MANRNVILQWNIDGLKGRRHELDILISEYSPAIICLQESKLPFDFEKCDKDKLPYYVKIKGYVPYFRCKPTGHNGVAIYVKDKIIHSQINIGQKWQALAVRVTFQGKEFIVSNHYTPGSNDADYPKTHDFETMIKNFDKPYIMCGDFNAKSTLWSGEKDDNRALAILDFMLDNDLGILNSEINTHYDRGSKSWSLIDLSIIHTALYMDFDCEVLSRRGSDHCPIIIKLNEELFETEKIPQWNFKRANWKSFKEQCKREINEELFEGQEDKMQVFTEKLIDIAGDNIPKTSPFYKKCSKPWFNKECTAARRERTRANRLLRRNPCQENHIEAKKANAKATRTFKRKKRESWRNYVSSINSRTPTKKVWNMVRKITGKNTKSHMLHLKDQKGNLITNKDDIANEIGSTFEKSSSSNNYSDKFKNIKMKEERKHLDFHAGENYKYNNIISVLN